MNSPETTPPTYTDRPALLAPEDMADAYGVGLSVRLHRPTEHQDADQ